MNLVREMLNLRFLKELSQDKVSGENSGRGGFMVHILSNPTPTPPHSTQKQQLDLKKNVEIYLHLY